MVRWTQDYEVAYTDYDVAFTDYDVAYTDHAQCGVTWLHVSLELQLLSDLQERCVVKAFVVRPAFISSVPLRALSLVVCSRRSWLQILAAITEPGSFMVWPQAWKLHKKTSLKMHK